MLTVIEKLLPSIANWRINKKVREKIENREHLNLPSEESSIEKLQDDELNELFESDLRWKDKLEDKAKTNVIGVTISVTLIMGAYVLVQNISDKFGMTSAFWIAFCLFVLSVVYMLEAGVHAIHVLTAENIVYYPKAGLEGEEKKKEIDLQIGLNRAQNTLRNNYVFTSYECIRNALVCLFVVMVIAIVPVNKQKESVAAYVHGIYYYSAQAMSSIANGIDKNKVESFIDTDIKDGEYSVVDQKDGLFLKYSISNGNVTVYLVEQITE